MQITKFGHACLLIETSAARVLIDPGAFSAGFEKVDGLSAIPAGGTPHRRLLPRPGRARRNRGTRDILGLWAGEHGDGEGLGIVTCPPEPISAAAWGNTPVGGAGGLQGVRLGCRVLP
jgi:hypothetical protein